MWTRTIGCRAVLGVILLASAARAQVFPLSGGDVNTGRKQALYMVIRDVGDAPLSASRISEIRDLEDQTRRFYAANSGGTFDIAFAHILDVPLTLDSDGTRPNNWRNLAQSYVQSNYQLNAADFHSNVFDVNATESDPGQGWSGVYWGGTNDFAIQADIATNWGAIVMDHELGHRVRADHANAWRNLNNSDYSSYVWDGRAGQYVSYNESTHGWQPLTFGVRRDEYGNPFDIMGNISHGHFRTREKVDDLGWLTNTQIPDLNDLGEGTYRIYAHDELEVVVSRDGDYGVLDSYDPDSLYGLTYIRQGEQFDTDSGQWEGDAQRINIEYRAGRDGVQFYLDGGLLDLDSQGGTNRNNLERELEVGQSIADIDINRSQFFATSADVDFLSYNPPPPTNWSAALTDWFEFSVLGTGVDEIGSYADVSVMLAELLNGVAGGH